MSEFTSLQDPSFRASIPSLTPKEEVRLLDDLVADGELTPEEAGYAWLGASYREDLQPQPVEGILVNGEPYAPGLTTLDQSGVGPLVVEAVIDLDRTAELPFDALEANDFVSSSPPQLGSTALFGTFGQI